MDTTVFPDDVFKSALRVWSPEPPAAKLQRYAASEVHRRYIARRIPPPPSVRYGLLYGMGLTAWRCGGARGHVGRRVWPSTLGP